MLNLTNYSSSNLGCFSKCDYGFIIYSVQWRDNTGLSFSPNDYEITNGYSLCANNNVDPGEQCDDGNFDADDTCSPGCLTETSYLKSSPLTALVQVGPENCGDGKRAGFEVCDDGNLYNDDGCNGYCKAEEGFQCAGGSPTTPDTCTPICGDGAKVTGEICDDGNLAYGDGCSSICIIEPYYECSGGDKNNEDTCNPICADGVKIGSEKCDDGNSDSGDGCNSSCNIETGYTCSGNTLSISICTEICGDGIRFNSDPDYCDDGDSDSGDGCDSSCSIEGGFYCTGGDNSTPDSCVTECGDGLKAGAELCDDGNLEDGDGCDSICLPELDYACTGGGPTSKDTCGYICGNGIILTSLDNTKFCDDGNTNSNDGCDYSCNVEDGWVCLGGNETTATKCNPCSVEFCETCNTKNHLKCAVCEFKYRITDDDLCEKDSKIFMSSTAQQAVSTSATVSGAGAAVSMSTSLLNVAFPAALWSMMNQMQYFQLLILTRCHIPDDAKGMLAGNQQISMDMSFIPLESLPIAAKFINLTTYKQSIFFCLTFIATLELETLGLESGNSFLNCLKILLTFFLLALLHLFVICLPRFKTTDESKKCRKRMHKGVKSLVNLFTYTIYIRTIMESYQYILLANISGVFTLDFSSKIKLGSFLFSVFVLILVAIFIYLSFHIYHVSKRRRRGFRKLKRLRCEEFLGGIKTKNNPRLYSFLCLMRRLAMITLLLCGRNLGPQIVISGLVLILLPYLLFLIVVKPFQETENNVIEITNELFLLAACLWLCYFNKEGQWSTIITKSYMALLFGNTAIITGIILSKFFVYL